MKELDVKKIKENNFSKLCKYMLEELQHYIRDSIDEKGSSTNEHGCN